VRKDKHIRRASADQIRDMLAREGSRTDWNRVRAMSAEEIERLADEEDGPLPAGWDRDITPDASEAKQPVHIRLDAAVVRWFKAQGRGYQTRINAVLRAFVAARNRAGGPPRVG
jgi:uncharacterized protein (DUF4415 family)